jgi:Family of unknown function (DUF6599)
MKSVRLRYRILLISLLPCIAAAIYFSGQRYDAALIDFRTETKQQAPVSPVASPLSVELTSIVPASPQIAGFLQFGQARRYTKENLYEHVDGHAEYFISAGFTGLTVTEYIASGSVAKQAEIQAEVFDMGKSIQAFGVLADESGENASPVSVGAMGYRTSGGLNFIRGRYYVKITAYSPKTPVLNFAKVFADKLPKEKGSFEVFSKFPNLGKIEKTRFVKEGFHGLDFLHNVIEREYSTGDNKIKVALVTGSGQEMKSLLSSFLAYFKKYAIPYEKIEKSGKEVYKVMDKYEGNWFLIPAHEVLFSVFGTEDEGILENFVKAKG